MKWLSDLVDWASDFFAHRKGLLPLIGIALIFANLVIRLITDVGFLAETDLLLHIGLITALLGFMLAFAL